MKYLRAVCRAHAVHLHHDEAVVRHTLLLVGRVKILGRKRILRAGIDVLDDRVLLARTKILWQPDGAVNIRPAVAPPGHEWLWHRQLSNHFGRFQFANQPAVRATAQGRDRRRIHPRPCVHEIFPVRRELRRMRAVAISQHREPRAVKIHAAELDIIRVLPRHEASRPETKSAGWSDPQNPRSAPPNSPW